MASKGLTQTSSLIQISANITESAVYRFPGVSGVKAGSKTSQINWLTKAKNGPFGFLIIRPEGVNPMAPGIYIRGFLINLASTALMMWMLVITKIPNFKNRWFVVSLVGGSIAVFSNLQQWNFMFYPLNYCLANALDAAVGWSLVGFVLAVGTKKTPSRN